MLQIIYPITAKLMSENKHDELQDLYQKSAINLQVFGGLIMLGIFLNIKQIYHLIPVEYSGGIAVVFLIGLSKFYDVIQGNNNAIILNTKIPMGFGFRIAFSGYDGWVEYDFYSDVRYSRSGFGDFNFCNCLQYHQALVCCKEDEFVSLYQKHFAVFRNHYSSFSTFLLLGFFFIRLSISC